MELSKLLLNPARLRMMQVALARRQVTAGDLVSALPDIPRATIYHHIKLLEEHGLLKTVSENKVRGTLEKVMEPIGASELLAAADPTALISASLMGLLGEMDSYLKKNNADMARDRVFLNEGIFAVTDEEYDTLLIELQASLCKVINLPKTPERHLRKLTLISTLPQNEEQERKHRHEQNQ